MATLHQAAEETKVVLKWFAVAGVIAIILFFGVRIGMGLWTQIFPPPPPPFEVPFGKLPPISFPAEKTPGAHTYTINTVSGSLPALGDRVKVHRTVQIVPDLLALTRARERMNRINFKGSEIAIDSSTYRWGDSTALQRKLTLNILTNNFTLTSNYLSDPQVLGARYLPDETQATARAIAFLSDLGALPNDIDISKNKTSLLTIANNTLVPAASFASTQVIEINLLQKDIPNGTDSLPIYYPNSPGSTMQLFVGSGQYDAVVVSASFFHQNIGTENGSYPIISTENAYKNLQNGEGFIAAGGDTKNITITNVSLGYYLGEKNQNYLMPVIVFSNDNGFLGYVSAVNPTWIEQSGN